MIVQPWIQTASARAFPLSAPSPEHVAWRDVAASLGRLCRFNGHSLAFYSVAQHCLLVERLVEAFLQARRDSLPVLDAVPVMLRTAALDLIRRCAMDDDLRRRLRLAALLHDAHEAYVGDIVTPVARELARRAGHDHIAELKSAVDAAIYAAAGLPWPVPAAWLAVITAADRVALATEKADLLAEGPAWDQPLPVRAPWPTKPLPEHLATDALLARLAELLPGMRD